MKALFRRTPRPPRRATRAACADHARLGTFPPADTLPFRSCADLIVWHDLSPHFSYLKGGSGLTITPTAEAESDDIVVTARRREESLHDVPIAVTAFSGTALEQAVAVDITDISATTPTVTLVGFKL